MAIGETAELIVAIALNDNLSGPLSRMNGNLTKFAAGMQQTRKGAGELAGGLAKVATVGLIAVGAGIGVAVSQAVKFDDAMRQIETQAGASREELEKMKPALLGLAASVGTAPEDLAAGLFHVESAGFRGAKALDVLKIAAEGAKVGHADLESVTNALTGALNSGVKGIENTTEAMGTLNAIVGAGNMRMQDLSDAFGTGILVTAKTFGISIQSVGAAIADMTRQGVPAIDAATRLRMGISLLGAPTPKAVKLLGTIGISASQLAEDMRGPDGILGAITDLREHLDAAGLSATEQAQLLSRAFGGGRSSGAILTLVGDVGKLRDVQEQVNKGITAFPEAWAEAQKEVGFQWDKLKAGTTAAFITIGQAVLPKLTPLLDKLNAALFDNQTRIGEFAGKVADGVGTLIDRLEKVDWSPLIDGLKMAAGFAKTAFDLFTALPPVAQGAILSFAAINKISGGLIGKGLGDVAGGVIKIAIANFAARGSSPANPLFVADITGGGGAAGAGGSMLMGAAKFVLGPLAAVAIGSEIAAVINERVYGPTRDREVKAFTAVVDSKDISQIVGGLHAIEAQQKTSNVGAQVALIASNIPFIGDALGHVGPELERQRQVLLDQLQAMGYSRAQAERIAADARAALLRNGVTAERTASAIQALNIPLGVGNIIAQQIRDKGAATVAAQQQQAATMAQWGGKLDIIAAKDPTVNVNVNNSVTAWISANQGATTTVITGSIRYSGKTIPL